MPIYRQPLARLFSGIAKAYAPKEVPLPVAQDLYDLLAKQNTASEAGGVVISFVKEACIRFSGDSAGYVKLTNDCIQLLPTIKKDFRSQTPLIVKALLQGYDDPAFQDQSYASVEQKNTYKGKTIQNVLIIYALLRLDIPTIETLADTLLQQSPAPDVSEKIFHSILAQWRSDLLKKDDFETSSKLYKKLRTFCGDNNDLNTSFLRAGFASFAETFDAHPKTGQALLVNLYRLCGRSHQRKLEFMDAGFNTLTYLIAKKARINDGTKDSVTTSETETTLIDYLTQIQANKIELKESYLEFQAKRMDKEGIEKVFAKKRELENAFISSGFKIYARTAKEKPEVAKNLFMSLEKICAQEEVILKDDNGHTHEFVQNAIEVFPAVFQRNIELSDVLLNSIAKYADVDRSVLCYIPYQDEDNAVFLIAEPPGPNDPLLFFKPDPNGYKQGEAYDPVQCITSGFAGMAKRLPDHYGKIYFEERIDVQQAYVQYAQDLVATVVPLLTGTLKTSAWPQTPKRLVDKSNKIKIG